VNLQAPFSDPSVITAVLQFEILCIRVMYPRKVP
jgi:hypothetical protein